MSDPTERFSSRVSDYVKYRPSYPAALFDALERDAGLDRPSAIADVGSGTGIATELLLKRGHRVFAVEPNRAMREAAESLLAERFADRFVSVDGRAEATTLASESVKLVLAAQAFHWFEPEACRREFRRILRPEGTVALVWNDRSTDGSPFLVATKHSSAKRRSTTRRHRTARPFRVTCSTRSSGPAVTASSRSRAFRISSAMD